MTKRLIQKGNSKLKDMYMFNIPATKQVCGRICKGCYAVKEQVRFPKALEARTTRYEASLRDDFADRVTEELASLRKPFSYFRIHASGEFYSQEYVDKWVTIAKNNPNTKFYTYTKRVKSYDFSKLKALFNVAVVDSLHFSGLNYGPIENAPKGAFVCPDTTSDPKCGTSCTYCMDKTKAEVSGVFFKQH